MAGRWPVALALLAALALSALMLLRHQGQHPFAGQAEPAACAALAMPGTGGFTLTAPSTGTPADDLHPRAARCAVAWGPGGRVEVAVLTRAALDAEGQSPDTVALLDAWLKGEALAGSRFESVKGPWRAAYAERGDAGLHRIVVDDNGVLVIVAPAGLDAGAGLEAARGVVEALRAAPPAD